MELIVDEMNETNENIKDMSLRMEKEAIYVGQPVLSRETCLRRCGNKQFKLYTNAAYIIDYINGIITFDNPKDMLLGIEYFEGFINNKSKLEGSIIKILKCERINPICLEYFNGIKYNVLIYDNKTFQSIIGQIDFVLDWMIEAKQVCSPSKLRTLFLFVCDGCLRISLLMLWLVYTND